MIRTLAGMLIASVLAFGPAAAQSPDVMFEVGQSWTFEDAPQEESRLVIGAIQDDGDQQIIHVQIAPIPFRANADGFVIGGLVGHMPFAPEAVRKSVIALVDTDVAVSPEFKTGMKQWRDAEGGVFTISVGQAVDFVYEIHAADIPVAGGDEE